jgi:4-hydroxy-3-methylbut-2-en-1-yl diphosphate reductase
VRLVEVGLRAGAARAHLIDDAGGIDWAWFEGVSVMGLTAGASAPEDLVEDVIAACRSRYAVTVEEVMVTREDVVFKLPRVLTET